MKNNILGLLITLFICSVILPVSLTNFIPLQYISNINRNNQVIINYNNTLLNDNKIILNSVQNAQNFSINQVFENNTYNMNITKNYNQMKLNTKIFNYSSYNESLLLDNATRLQSLTIDHSNPLTSVFASFYTISNCNLSKIIVYGNALGAMVLTICNSTWNGSKYIPNSNYTYVNFTATINPKAYILNTNFYLNNSLTTNGIWFMRINGYSSNWNWYNMTDSIYSNVSKFDGFNYIDKSFDVCMNLTFNFDLSNCFYNEIYIDDLLIISNLSFNFVLNQSIILNNLFLNITTKSIFNVSYITNYDLLLIGISSYNVIHYYINTTKISNNLTLFYKFINNNTLNILNFSYSFNNISFFQIQNQTTNTQSNLTNITNNFIYFDVYCINTYNNTLLTLNVNTIEYYSDENLNNINLIYFIIPILFIIGLIVYFVKFKDE